MLTLHISKADLETANYERNNHPLPIIRKRFQVVWLLSQQYSRGQAAKIAEVSLSCSVKNYIKTCHSKGVEGPVRVEIQRAFERLGGAPGNPKNCVRTASRILLAADTCESNLPDAAISERYHVSPVAVQRIREKFVLHRVETALNGLPRGPQSKTSKIDGDVEAPCPTFLQRGAQRPRQMDTTPACRQAR